MPLWVVDFPLFEAIAEDGRPIPAHHPFTQPHPDDLDKLDATGDALLDVRSQAYDMVLNGWELGSGSVRIHQPGDAAADLLADRHGRGRGAVALRVPARRVPVRRAAARRLRVRRRPPRRAARGRGEHPRGDRVPQDAVGRRPAHRCAGTDRRRPAPRARPPRCSRPPSDRRPAAGHFVVGATPMRGVPRTMSLELRPARSHRPRPVRGRVPVRAVRRAAPDRAGVVAGADRAHARRRGLLGDHPPRRRRAGGARPGRCSRVRPDPGATVPAARSSRTCPAASVRA